MNHLQPHSYGSNRKNHKFNQPDDLSTIKQEKLSRFYFVMNLTIDSDHIHHLDEIGIHLPRICPCCKKMIAEPPYNWLVMDATDWFVHPECVIEIVVRCSGNG